MKVTKAQAAQNRQDILEAAARLYREHGLDGVGVAEVTRGAMDQSKARAQASRTSASLDSKWR
jgi:AcrR family transcriptional regulator